jgi:hypothetical protein
MARQQGFTFNDPESMSRDGTLRVVHARACDISSFDGSLFEGFDTMNALTYTSSIPMVVSLLRDHDFQAFECVFGHGGVLSREAAGILAFQAVLDEKLNQGFIGLDNLTVERREVIYNRVAQGTVRFHVVKDAIAHAKIYLLERDGLRRVIVGSANLSETAFSGRQSETLIAFDNDDTAWRHYRAQYEAVRDNSTSHVPLRRAPVVASPGLFNLEETPSLREAEANPDGITLYVPQESPIEAEYAVPHVAVRVEAVKPVFKRALADIRPDRKGNFRLASRVIKQITRLSRSRQAEDAPPTYLALDSGCFTLSGQALSLDADPDEVAGDVERWVAFFGNYENGFVGDVPRLQRDYFTFMCWFYFSPFMCDLRSAALRRNVFSFDQPMFAVLYGSSNCGKTSLVETLMTSMFSYPRIVETRHFTHSNLRGLQQAYRRFPVVFDDVTRDRFNRHADEIIKDETIPYSEYPCFALSMNADARTFRPEIVKRSLMLYTRTALPGDATDARRNLQRSVTAIRDGMTTALYRTYLKRALQAVGDAAASENDDIDALRLSSDILCTLFRENLPPGADMPHWCRAVTLQAYQKAAFERPRLILDRLLRAENYRKEQRPPEGYWGIWGDAVVVAVAPLEFSRVRSDIPDWILDDTASSLGQIVMRRDLLEEFLGRRITRSRRWFGSLGGR